MLKEHNSVIVSINHPLQNVPDKVYNVSSLCVVGHSLCSVPVVFRGTHRTHCKYIHMMIMCLKYLLMNPMYCLVRTQTI